MTSYDTMPHVEAAVNYLGSMAKRPRYCAYPRSREWRAPTRLTRRIGCAFTTCGRSAKA